MSSGLRLLATQTRFGRWLWRILKMIGSVCAGWMAFAACSSSNEPGIQLTVTMSVAPGGGDNGSMHVETDTGYTVTLERAYMSLGAVEILGCNETGTDALLRWFEPKLALAHTTSSPTRIGEPFVVSLLAEADASEVIGALLPPPGKYCVAQVELDAADDDARGLPADVDMVGATLDIRGRWSSAEDSNEDFALRTSEKSTRLLDRSFLLSRDERQHTLALVAVLNHAFDGVDFVGQTETEQAKTVLFNVSRGLAVDVQ